MDTEYKPIMENENTAKPSIISHLDLVLTRFPKLKYNLINKTREYSVITKNTCPSLFATIHPDNDFALITTTSYKLPVG